MLHCNINLSTLTDEQLQCQECKTCQPKSALKYPFKMDLTTSHALVEELKQYIESNTPYKCKAPERFKHPDLRIVNITVNDRLICWAEAKLLTDKAFMKAEKILKDHLKPKETLVIDAPKLLSYFQCKVDDREKYQRDIPIFVVWCFGRPCADIGGITVFQEIGILKQIYDTRKNARAFERETADGDMLYGKKLGVTSKYHFSLRECRPIEELCPEILKIQ